MFDTTWNFVMWLLPDATVGTFEMRDWLNVAIAGIGLRLAVVANRISKKQDQILEEQRAKHPELSFMLFPKTITPPYIYDVSIVNSGTKQSDNFDWNLILPVRPTVKLTFDARDAQMIKREDGELGLFNQWQGHVVRPVYKGTNLLIGTLAVEGTDAEPVTAVWSIKTDEARWPKDKPYGTLSLLEPGLHLLEAVGRTREPRNEAKL